MSNQSRVVLITLLLVLAFGAWLLPSQAQRSVQKSAPSGAASSSTSSASKSSGSVIPRTQAGSITPIYAQANGFAESKPVRELPAASTSISTSPSGGPEIEGHEVNELNTERVRKPDAGPSFDAALQGSTKAPVTPRALPNAPSLTFEGIDAADEGNSVAPPDTNADVGPRDIVETVNNRVRVYDKNGNPRGPAFTQSSLFAPLKAACDLAAFVDDGDPVVLYDRMADRWMISQFAFTATNQPPYHEAIAISKTGDPTGGYFLYDFVLPGNEFPDYPKFGVWPDGYYMTSNQFLMGGAFDGVGAFAFDRNKMLVGDPTAGLIYFNLNLASHPEGIFGMLPSDQDGLLPPPAFAPNVFIYFTDNNFGDPADGLRLFNFHADFAIPANSTFTERTESTYATPLPLASFDARTPGGRSHVEEPAPGENLDSVGERMMYRLQYRNRNGVESLVSNFTVNVSGVSPTNAANYQAGFRYFELQKTSPGGLYGVTEQATFAPGSGNGATGPNRWMGSAANDNQNNILVGYSLSSTTIFPSLNYAGRAFTDPPNGLSGEFSMFPGTGVQLATGNRWGDYSSMQVDPSDDCSFWFASEYYTTNNASFNWRTRIGKVAFTTCTAPAQGTLTGTVTACDSGVPLSDVMVTATGGPSGGFSSTTLPDGTYSFNLAPGNYSVSVTSIPHECTAGGPFNVSITNGATTTLNTCLSGQADTAFVSAAISGGNGNGVIEANECNNLNVTISSTGCSTASNVFGVLSSSTPGVTITQPNSPYPDMIVGSNGTNTVPFSVSTSPSFVCGTPIAFTLTTNFTGGTDTLNFTLPTCQCAPTTVTGSITAGDLTQTGRMGRNAVASSCCPFTKPCPGALAGDSTAHHYDIYSFTNGPAAACVTITTTTTCVSSPNQIITVAYLGSFNPANLCTNYLGDPGGSPAPTNSFDVTVPANGTLLVNVQEITTNGGCSSYSVTVSGLVCATSGTGPCAPCMITCPASINQTTTGAPGCPIASAGGATVNYPAPTTTGTCGNVTCSPASGSVFPAGTTTVTCTTTAGPSCSFTVTLAVFSFCLQDDSNPGSVVLVNASTGDFSFCCGGTPVASGRGNLTTRGCAGSIDNSKGDRQVHIQWDTAANNGNGAGTAYVQKRNDKTICQITDKNMSNDTCQCSAPPPSASPTKPGKQRNY
jgi:hypothetical protein